MKGTGTVGVKGRVLEALWRRGRGPAIRWPAHLGSGYWVLLRVEPETITIRAMLCSHKQLDAGISPCAGVLQRATQQHQCSHSSKQTPTQIGIELWDKGGPHKLLVLRPK